MQGYCNREKKAEQRLNSTPLKQTNSRVLGAGLGGDHRPSVFASWLYPKEK